MRLNRKMHITVLLLVVSSVFISCANYQAIQYSLLKEKADSAIVVLFDTTAFRISTYVFSTTQFVKRPNREKHIPIDMQKQDSSQLNLYAYFLPKDTSSFELKQASFRLLELDVNHPRIFDLFIGAISSKKPTIHVSDAAHVSSTEPIVSGRFIMDSLYVNTRYILQFNGIVKRDQQLLQVSGSDTVTLMLLIHNVHPIR